jgi:hypothetical protein
MKNTTFVCLSKNVEFWDVHTYLIYKKIKKSIETYFTFIICVFNVIDSTSLISNCVNTKYTLIKEEPIYSRSKNTRWEMTSYILSQGGDLNFQFKWNQYFTPGLGNSRGTALNYIWDLKNQFPEQNQLSKLFEIFWPQVTYIQIYFLALVCYRGLVFLADFQINPILTYLNLTNL